MRILPLSKASMLSMKIRHFFLQFTTYERKTGFLLIEVFRKLINPQIEGHLDHLQVAFPIYQR